MNNSLEIIPSKDPRESLMKQVYLHADDSKDPRTKIGAVLAIGNRVISTGFNGFPSKVIDYADRYNHRHTKYKYVCHAEANAVFIAAKLGRSTLSSTLYTQGIPCCECAKAIIQSGVQKVVIHKQWPNLVHSNDWVESIRVSKTMFDEAGIEIEEFDKLLEVEGFLDGKKINV